MAADIRLGKFDDQKYVDHLRDEKNEARQTAKANGNGDSKPKNGGYQNNFVRPGNNSPDGDQLPPNADDGPPLHLDDGPPCGPDDSDGSMIVKLQNDAEVGVASLEEPVAADRDCAEGWNVSRLGRWRAVGDSVERTRSVSRRQALAPAARPTGRRLMMGLLYGAASGGVVGIVIGVVIGALLC